MITVGMDGDIMRGGSVASPPYTNNDEITYTCQAGWFLVGQITTRCQGSPTFQWTVVQTDVPRCLLGKHKLSRSFAKNKTSAIVLQVPKVHMFFAKAFQISAVHMFFFSFLFFFWEFFGSSSFPLHYFQAPENWTREDLFKNAKWYRIGGEILYWVK